MDDSYKDHPQSIGEIVAKRTQSGSRWTPRDALINALRDLDSGRIKPDALFIAAGQSDGEGGISTTYYAAGASTYMVLGVAARATNIYQQTED